MIHITGTTAVNIPPCAGVLLQVNATIASQVYTLVDGAGVTQAVITAPLVGSQYIFYGLVSSPTSPATLTAGLTGDATLSTLSRTMS